MTAFCLRARFSSLSHVFDAFRSTRSFLDGLPAEAWAQLDSAIAHITTVLPAATATFDATTTAGTPSTDEASPCPASNCSSEYDTTWIAAANLTQLEVAAGAQAVAVEVAAPASPTPTAHPSSDDTLAAALDTIATQDVVFSTLSTAAAAVVAANPTERSDRWIFADVAAGVDQQQDRESASPSLDKLCVKRLFLVPDTDSDAWDAHAAAAHPLSGDTLVIPETPAFASSIAASAADETLGRGGGTAVRRGNQVCLLLRFVFLMFFR